MQTLLYYPYVNPPSVVVWQGLLYWDGIASITPPDYQVTRNLTGRTAVEDLAARDLYSPIRLDQIPLDLGRIELEIAALIQGMPSLARGVAARGRPREEQTFLYYGKVPDEVQAWLLDS